MDDLNDIVQALLHFQDLGEEVSDVEYQLYFMRIVLEILYYFEANMIDNLVVNGTRQVHAMLRTNVRNVREDLEEYLCWNEQEQEFIVADEE